MNKAFAIGAILLILAVVGIMPPKKERPKRRVRFIVAILGVLGLALMYLQEREVAADKDETKNSLVRLEKALAAAKRNPALPLFDTTIDKGTLLTLQYLGSDTAENLEIFATEYLLEGKIDDRNHLLLSGKVETASTKGTIIRHPRVTLGAQPLQFDLRKYLDVREIPPPITDPILRKYYVLRIAIYDPGIRTPHICYEIISAVFPGTSMFGNPKRVSSAGSHRFLEKVQQPVKKTMLETEAGRFDDSSPPVMCRG